MPQAIDSFLVLVWEGGRLDAVRDALAEFLSIGKLLFVNQECQMPWISATKAQTQR